MNFVLDNYQIDEKNISFLETKKNNIIDGNFTKIIYKDTFVTVNGIYLLFPITITNVDKSNGKTNVFFNPKVASNTLIINHISDIESKIINCYKQEYNVSYKRNMSTLFNLLYNGKIKLYKEINHNPSRVIHHSALRMSNLENVTFNSFGVKRVEPLESSTNMCDLNRQRCNKIVLKISGIWETTNEIGITYKFLDME